MEKISWAEQIK